MFGKAEPIGKHSAAAQAQRATDEAPETQQAAGTTGGAGKIVAIVCAVLVGVLALAYVAGALIFANLLFMPATSINGEDVSLRPMSEVAAEHTERAESYKLAVLGQGLDISIPSSNIDLALDGAAFVEGAASQVNAWAWPVLMLESRELAVDVLASFDGAKVERLVGAAVDSANEGATPPVDAEVAFVTESGRYEVVGGTPGTELDAQAVTTVVSIALTELQPRASITADQLVQPSVKADDETLNAQVESLNRYVGATQTLTVLGNEVFVVDGNQIIQWVTNNPDGTSTVNGEAITAWAKGELSERLDSVGSSRSYTRADGKQITVAGGSYGWSIDGAALAGQMTANIEAGTVATIEVPMLQTAAVWNPGGVDWGARYVDVDLSEQYVRLFDDAGALIWESSCVSGKTSDGHATPTGVYAMNDYRASGNVELRGKIDPKTNQPEYISYVTYWMPFIDNAVALHDASWRSSFGGTIYQYNGSHGCVNLPSGAAASLFNLVHVGDVVVVHS